MITNFEDLPNEILINILEYISCPIDIYRSFDKLNRRFDIILRSIRLNIDVFGQDKQYLTLIHCFSAYCNRLRVFSIYPSIRLTQFSRLRSLTMNEPTNAQINSIQAKTLPTLEYLATPASMIIFDCLFGTDEQQWSFLRSCNFYFSHFPTSKLTWRPNRILSTLAGITCSRNTLSQLLSLLPRLKHLRVEMIVDDSSNWNSAIFQKTLSSLRIGFHRLIYDDFCVLIGPCLRRLYIEIYDDQVHIDFVYLATLLTFLTRKLKQFNCDYRGTEISIDAIRNAHPLFSSMQSIQSPSYDTISLICQDMI